MKVSPKQEDEQVIAVNDDERGLTDQEKNVDVESEVYEEIVGAPDDVIELINDNDMENGRVFGVDDPPDGLDDNEHSVEEKAEGNKASLLGIAGATQTDEEIDRAVGCATPSHMPVGLATDSLATAAQSMTLDPDNTVRNKDPPQPLSSPNHTPSAIHGPVDIAFTVSKSKSSHEDAGEDQGKFDSGSRRGEIPDMLQGIEERA